LKGQIITVTLRHKLNKLVMSGCCPEGALGYLQADYSSKGEERSEDTAFGGKL